MAKWATQSYKTMRAGRHGADVERQSIMGAPMLTLADTCLLVPGALLSHPLPPF